MTEVFNGVIDASTTANSWLEITLTTPFLWDGASNLVVAIDENTPTYGNSPTWKGYTLAPSSGSKGIYFYQDATDVLPASPSASSSGAVNLVAQIQFEMSSATPCSGMPTAGSATSSVLNGCSGTPFNLSLTGQTQASGLAFQWQSGATATGPWANISGANTLNYSTSQTANTWYRCRVSCGTDTANSDAVEVITPALVGGTYTIDNALPTGGGNFASFADALSYIACGINAPVVFNVASGSGPYLERLVLNHINGASATNTITFNGNGATLQYSATGAADRVGIHLNGADHIIIDSLIIDGSAGAQAWGIVSTNQADSNIIRKCTINVGTTGTTTNFLGIAINGSTTAASSAGNNGNGNLIENNTIIGGYYGIYLYGSSTLTSNNNNNKVINNTLQDFYYYGMYLFYQSSGLVISKNNLSRPTRTTVTTGYGIYVGTACVGALMEKNRLHNMFDGAPTSTSIFYNIYVSADGTLTDPTRVENNAIYNIGGNGSLYGIYSSGSAYLKAYHNTISLDNAAATAGATYGFYQVTSADGIEFKNNIVNITRGGSGAKYCIYKSTAATPLESNNNVLYVNSLGAGAQSIGYQSSAKATLLDWQTATSQDALSYSMDPLFTDPSTGNYLFTESQIDDKGAMLSVVTDILDSTRSVATPDPGAWEKIITTLCSGMPTAGTTTSSAANVCNGTSFVLGLNGVTQAVNLGYQWQSAPTSAGPWTDIAGANLASFITSQSDTTWYRCRVSCGTDTANSDGIEVTTPALVGGTYTIDNALPTGGGNFASFTEAVSYISCGINAPVVFNVASGSGPYLERLEIDEIIGASATNTITFNGNGATLQYNSSTTETRTGIHLNGADHIIIDSLIIDGSAGTYAWGIALTNQADSNIIRKSTINVGNTGTTSNFLGIAINGSSIGTATSGNNGNGNLIENNTIIGGYYGIYLYGSSTLTTDNNNNKVINNTLQDFYYYGMYLFYQSSGLVVSKNNLSRPTRTTLTTGYGIYVGTACVGALIEKNRLHNMFDGAPSSTSTFYNIYVTADGTTTEPTRVENNAIYNIGGNGSLYGIYSSGSAYLKAYHNTISLENAAATAGATYGFYQITSADGIEFKNNIVNITRGGSGAKYCIYKSTAATPIESNNNVLYVNSLGSGAQSIGYQTSAQATLLDWQTASSQDALSYSVDPLFTDPSTGNYLFTESSIDDKGAALGVVTDIIDTVRSTTSPDPGAWEAPPVIGFDVKPTELVSPLVVSSGCYNTDTLTVAVYNNGSQDIDFSTKNLTITINITGAVTSVYSATINTGSLLVGETKEFKMTTPGATLDMSTAGVYNFAIETSLTGDINAANNIINTTREKIALSGGTATVSQSNVCVTGTPPTLSATGASGFTSVQWQSSTTSGTGFTDMAGADTITYALPTIPNTPMFYRLVATCGSTNNNSSEISITLNNPQITSVTNDTSCGAGSVTLAATTNATTIKWYENLTGGIPIATGNTYTTPVLNTTTTYYVAASSGSGGSAASPLQITEMDLGTVDKIELQNVSPDVLNVTGWKVVASNTYTNINDVNPIVQTLSGTLNPGQIITFSDQAGADYWGNNLFWNPGAFPTYAGWAMILDNNNVLKDVIFLNWPAANIQSMSITVNGTPITIGSNDWSGNGVDITNVLATEGVARKGNLDNNNSTDFEVLSLSIGTTNANLTLPMNGFDCESVRSAVLAVIDNDPSCIVPVTFTSFTGKKEGSINVLNWATATETNNLGYELQRSADGRSFSKLDFINTKATNGNSNTALSYTYQDTKPLIGNNYYRLKQIDKDGKTHYSNVVNLKGDKATQVNITGVYPNPTRNTLNVSIASPSAERVSLVITDISGKVLMQQNVVLNSGDNVQTLDVSKLSQGTYLIKTICNNGCESAVIKFAKY
jgi:hypothetical protein